MTRKRLWQSRVRYLIRDPKSFGQQEWFRVWSGTWKDWPGEKKIVSGKTTLFHFGAKS